MPPHLVAEARSHRDQWLLGLLPPLFALVLAVPALAGLHGDAQTLGAGIWLSTLLGLLGWLWWSLRDAAVRERADAAEKRTEREPGPMDQLVDAILARADDASDRAAILSSLRRACSLREDAARARAAADQLPPASEGRRALYAAAERAAAEARTIDDRLAAIAAELISPAPTDVPERLAAQTEVARVLRATWARAPA